MAQVHALQGCDQLGAAPTFEPAVEASLTAHTVPGAWPSGTATKYRQTLTMLVGHLVDGGPAVVRDVATLDIPGGAAALLTADSGMCTDLAPANGA